MGDEPPASRWASRSDVPRGDRYDERWRRLEATGHSIHGEVDFVQRYAPGSVLDAGCGTGRVAIELSRRGIDAVGTDLDPAMLATARSKAPELEWIEADLAELALGRTFDAAVLAGNVMIFLRPGSERRVVANLAAHLAPEGVLIAGFQLGRAYDLPAFDEDCAAAGLVAEKRFSNWDGDVWTSAADYAVSVFRRPFA